MTVYSRSAYRNPFSANVDRNNARARGWGSGWPNCQTNKMKTIVAQDQTKGENYDIRVTVREEIAEMVANLLEATDKQYDLKKSSTGAYNCRAIRGTNTPSNHSWGLAVDINWNDNPMSYTFHSEIPPAVVAMWNDCGWYWGGFYSNRHDTMHFEYIGTPSDVARHTAKAVKYNKGEVVKKPGQSADSKYGAYFSGTIGSRTTKKWDRGDDVKLIQRYLGLPDDGYFGAKTESRVKEWQYSQDLQSDGKVGVRSWAVIKRVLKGI